MKRYYRAASLIAGLIITALFIWYVTRSLRGHDLSVYATPRAASGIVMAAVCWSMGAPLLALAWRALLSGLGVDKKRRELFGIIGVSQFAKYVPGNVAQYVGRVGMSLARGIPPRALAVTMIVETLLVVAAAGVVGIGAGALSDVGLQAVRQHGVQLALVAVLVGIAATALITLQYAGPALLRRLAPRYALVLEGGLFPPRSSMVRAFLWCCSVYVIVGIGLVLLARLLLPGSPQDDWLLISAFSLAWVVGFVAPGAPGGLGVREGLLLLMLAPVYTTASAGILIIALRIATTLGDVLDLVVGMIALPPRKHAATATPPASER